MFDSLIYDTVCGKGLGSSIGVVIYAVSVACNSRILKQLSQRHFILYSCAIFALLAIEKVTSMAVLVITINALENLQVFGYPLVHLARVESANCMQRRPW